MYTKNKKTGFIARQFPTSVTAIRRPIIPQVPKKRSVVGGIDKYSLPVLPVLP